MGNENQNLPVRSYAPQYRKLLSTVFDVRKAFSGVLAPIQVLDGVQMNETAFKVKTSNTPVVIGTYDKGANVGMGTGTGKSSRFGNRQEIIYTDMDVPYDYELKIHEGLDRYTVNNDLDAAVADRLKLQSEAQTRYMNVKVGAHLSTNAGVSKTLSAFDEAAIKSLFNSIAKYYVNQEVDAPVTAYVTTDLKTAIVDMQSTTSAKGSSVSIDSNGVVNYKGFIIDETAEKYFASGDIAYFSPDNLVNPFVGISTARTMESEDFDGVALQAAAKGGNFTLDDNKAAIVKVTTSAIPEG